MPSWVRECVVVMPRHGQGSEDSVGVGSLETAPSHNVPGDCTVSAADRAEQLGHILDHQAFSFSYAFFPVAEKSVAG